MDADALSIAGSISQLELSVDRNLAGSSRDEVVSAEGRLHVVLQGMRGHLNALAPVNSLPPEMLVAIFKEALKLRAKPPVLDHNDFDHKKIDLRPLFSLVHVCRLWRSAAVGDASFWSHIDVTHPEEGVKFFLERSSGYPLTLYASSEKASLVERILKEHGARIRAVYLDRKEKKRDIATLNPRALHAALHHGAAAFIPGAVPFPPPAGPPFLPPGPALFAQPGPAPFAQPGAAAFAQLAAFAQAQHAAAPLPPGVPPFPQVGGGLFPQPGAAPLFPGAAPFQLGAQLGAALPLHQGAAPIHHGAAPPHAGAAHFHPALAPPFHPFYNSNLDSEETLSSVFQHFCSSAPQLECFTLREVRLGSNLFRPLRSGGHYPQTSDSPLKALALLLSDAFFPGNSFPNLTHLFLSFPLSRPRKSAESLLQMLSRAPRLQFLQLSKLHTNTTSPEAFIHPLPHVSLGQLRLLHFSDVQLEAAFYLLKYLALPESVLLSIEGGDGNNPLRHGFSPSLRLPPVAPLNVATFMEIYIDFRKLLLTWYDARFTSGVLFKAHDYSEFWSATWLPELHDMMSLSMITVLHINDDGGTVLAQLLPYFVQLEQLSILSLSSIRRAGSAAGAIFASLMPVTTLVCPALHSIGLQANIDHNSFPYAELQAMAVGRHERGHSLRRFVYQFHGNAKPWSTAEAEEKERMSLLETSLSPLLQPYVDAIEYRLSSSAEKLRLFVLPECWRVPDAERYWRIPRDKKPRYGMPWDVPEPVDGDDDSVQPPQTENDESGVYDLATLFD